MLKKMILINSANFQFADIDLSKEIFFVGDNASGKTTTTRALHFLYNSDGQKLGIPRSKDSFLKHYFPRDDSYIIYVFDTFFIFTYSRNHTIRRFFSKQKFEYEKVIKDGKLAEFKEIETYIKSATLKVKPQTIEEYTAILYGKNKKYLDFSIAKIENYKIFLDIFNMIFNIDKAIVTASDIKKAIQKSLDKEDELLSIDYDDFIRKLNSYSRAYHFFKIFDANRENLKNAISIKDALYLLEQDLEIKQKAINYRYGFENNELLHHRENIKEIVSKVSNHKNRIKNIENFYEKFEARVSKKMKSLTRDIVRLEELKKRFNPLDIKENTLVANKYESLKKDLDAKKISLASLKEKQTTVQKEIQKQIDEIEHKINVTIPNEMSKNIYELSELERLTYENELSKINNEIVLQEGEVKQNIRAYEYEVDLSKGKKNSVDYKILEEQNRLKNLNRDAINILELEKVGVSKSLEDAKYSIRKLKDKKYTLEEEFQKHQEKYKTLRIDNAKELNSKRVSLNNKIVNARMILNPLKNSLNEFFSDEIDGWENSIYPIIDKDLLKKSCDELKPEILDAKVPLGFKLDTSTLAIIPTKDEALEIIKQVRDTKKELLKNYKLVYKMELSKLDEVKNKLIADTESCIKELDHSIDDKSNYSASIEKLTNKIKDKEDGLVSEFKAVDAKYAKIKQGLSSQILDYEDKIKRCHDELKELEKEKRKRFTKAKNSRDNNINILKTEEKNKLNQSIKEQKELIDKLLQKMKLDDASSMIVQLENDVKVLTKESEKSYDAKRFLQDYEEKKDEMSRLPSLENNYMKYEQTYENRKKFIVKIIKFINYEISGLNGDKNKLEIQLKSYEDGVKNVQSKNITIGEEKLETHIFLVELIKDYEDIQREYSNKKVKFRELIDKLKKLEQHTLIELNFNTENFSEVKSILELENIIDSLTELEDFEKNKYESQKKRSHNDFELFLKGTIPQKLQSFEDLENEFEKAKISINRSLSYADFGVIRDIKLTTDSSKSRNDSIASLLKELSKKVKDTIGMYSNKSLFYFDIPKSVKNIEDIQTILEDIKKKGSNGAINLFDTIDLSISYVENGKKVENKLNIKDESSSGGNILLKVAIAMSILSRFAKKISSESPFFLIIDEVSKLQSKNQDLIRKYINENGFKTLFITPDPAYPDPQRAIYYTFKNIQEDTESLEIRQMNIV